VSKFDRALISHMTTPEGLALVLNAKLTAEVFEEPVCSAMFGFIVEYWDKSEPKRPPTLQVIQTEFPGIELPEAVEEDTGWIIKHIQTLYAANELHKVMFEAAKTSVSDPDEATHFLHRETGKILDSMGRTGGGLLDRLSVDGEWLDAQQFTPQEYVVDRLVPEGVGVLAGPPKKGKSFLVSNLGLAVAQGGIALGAIRVAQRPVLYLALEDSHGRLRRRLRLMNGDQPLPKALSLVIHASPEQAFQAITEYLDRYRVEKPFVILDTLGKVKRARRPGEEPYQVDYAMGVKLKEIADTAPGCSILVVHHSRKAAAEDFVDTVSGTQGIAGSVDFVMVLHRKRHSDDATLDVTGRDVEEGEYALHADHGVLWKLAGVDLTEATRTAEQRRDQVRLGERSLEVLAFVNSRYQTTANDVMTVSGMDRRQANQLLRRLYETGRIAKPSHGVYAPHRRTQSEGTERTERFGANTQAMVLFPKPHLETASEGFATSEGFGADGPQTISEPEEGKSRSSEGRSSDPSLPSVPSDPSLDVHNHDDEEEMTHQGMKCTVCAQRDVSGPPGICKECRAPQMPKPEEILPGMLVPGSCVRCETPGLVRPNSRMCLHCVLEDHRDRERRG